MDPQRPRELLRGVRCSTVRTEPVYTGTMSSPPPDKTLAWPGGLEERAATDADGDALWRLHVDTMRTYVAATYGWVDAVQESMFRESWPKRRAQRVLVDQGTIVAAWLAERKLDHVFLTFVEVAPSHQRRGLGSEIVRRTRTAAAALGLALKLTVMKANPGARRLYERLGLRLDGETATHHVMVATSYPDE